MIDSVDADSKELKSLNRIFIRCLLALGEQGKEERHLACQLAASAWSELRHAHPREAERLNGVMHSLTRSTTQPATTAKETRHASNT